MLVNQRIAQWLPDRVFPCVDARSVLDRAGQIAHQIAAGWVGVEHVWLAAHEGIADHRHAVGLGWRKVIAESVPALGLRVTPRLTVILRELPHGFSIEHLVGSLRHKAQPVLRFGLAWQESESQESSRVTQMTQAVQAANSPPNALEVLGGPDDGRLVRLSPGEVIGGIGADHVVKPLPAGLAPKVIKWCGEGRVAAVGGARIHVALSRTTRTLLGEHTLAEDDVLEVAPGIRFRAIVYIADLSLSARDTTLLTHSAVPPHQIARRYTLIRPLGRGGMGIVYDAIDQLTGQRIAVKLMKSWTPQQVSAGRREQVALRWLRLPGVVQVFDEGIAEGWWFVAMELVEGVHFPVHRGGSDWNVLGPLIFSLLEVLGRVHAAGVLHLDLKPENALVTPTGRVILLDFGLATGAAIARSSIMGSGTPAYMSPEQVAQEACDERSDLYAVGVMIYEGLTGRIPHESPSPLESMHDRAVSPELTLRARRPDLPDAVIHTVDALLSVDPAHRPASAAEVARMLWGQVSGFDNPPIHLPESFTTSEALVCFHGPEHFFHLPSDGSAALHRRADGHGETARAELGAWIRGGLATWDTDRMRVDRDALARLELLAPLRLGQGKSPEREVVEKMLSSGLADVVRSLPAVLRDDIDHSRVERALALAHLGLVMAREVGDSGLELELLILHFEAAIHIDTARALELMQYELGRTDVADRAVAPLRRLGAACVALRNGELARAADLLATIPPFDHPKWDCIEIVRHDALVRSECLGVDGHDAWATTTARQNRVMIWQGREAYREARWLDAIGWFRQVQDRAMSPHEKLAAGLRAGFCIMETGDTEAAFELGRQLQRDAHALRLGSIEAEAVLLGRNASYRRTESLRAEPTLCESAALVSWSIEGRFAVLEACFAWRSGDIAAAKRLAQRATASIGATQTGGGATLTRALELAIVGADEGVGDLLLLNAAQARYPEWRLQIVGLVHIARGGNREDLRQLAQTLSLGITPLPVGGRMDVLSIEEAISGSLDLTSADLTTGAVA